MLKQLCAFLQKWYNFFQLIIEMGNFLRKQMDKSCFERRFQYTQMKYDFTFFIFFILFFKLFMTKSCYKKKINHHKIKGFSLSATKKKKPTTCT